MIWLVCGVSLVLTVLRGGPSVPLAILLCTALVARGATALVGGAAAVGLFCASLWWTAELPPIASGHLLLFAVLALTVPYLPRLLPQANKTQRPRSTGALALLVLFPLGIATGLLTGPFISWGATATAWHHWSAYLSPVEALLAGGVPFRDFPIQYGCGPTLLLAASCGRNCAQGLFTVAVVANALYFTVLTCCALILTQGLARGRRIMTVAAMFCATMLWTGLPLDVVGPAQTPSVAGLRFLPIALLLLHILDAEAHSKRRDWIGHLIWLADVFWSPEAAFFGSLVWWPYLALRNGEARDKPVAGLVRGGLIGITCLGGALGAGALAYQLVYGTTLRLDSYLAYLLHPPGPLAVNPLGSVWMGLATIVIALPLLMMHGLSPRARPLYATLLGLFAAGTYYLSRAHDNNILNLFPFLILVMLASLELLNEGQQPLARFGDGFVKTLLAAIIAGPALFGSASWDMAWRSGRPDRCGTAACPLFAASERSRPDREQRCGRGGGLCPRPQRRGGSPVRQLRRDARARAGSGMDQRQQRDQLSHAAQIDGRRQYRAWRPRVSPLRLARR